MTTSQPQRAARLLLLSIGMLCLLPAVLNAANQTWPSVAPGIEYLHERIGDVPWSIHVVKVDRSNTAFQMRSSLAQGHIYGLSPLTEQIEAVADKTVAAVNGDFFHIRPGPYQGDPTGLQIIGGELVSSPGRTSFWIDPNGQPHIGIVKAKFRATGLGDVPIPFELNQKREDDGVVLFTPSIGLSTRTEGGLELVLTTQPNRDWLPLRAGHTYVATISDVNEAGDTPLSDKTMVLSIGPELCKTLPRPNVGDSVTLNLELTPDLKNVTTAVGGWPILIEDGVVKTWDPPLPRHPRTAIGWNKEQFSLVVVDGRQAGLSAGMTFPELAALMQRLGCTEAINLDGGGSSTLWLGGQVMNSPSDGHERPVANALLIVSTEEEDH